MTGFSALPASAEPGAPVQWLGTSKVSGLKLLKMPVLTIGMLGLQIIWSAEMSYASPYLLSLGMSKSFMSIVFLAGPLSGLIVQPLIGILSDHSHSRFGRRRPYILFGSLICFGAMYLLGFTREFASVMTKRGSPANNALTIGLAVWSIYCIDFSINAVQAMDRALLVDILPGSEQERGNAWAGRMFGLGSVLGFFVGNVDLRSSFPFFGNTQLEILCVITSSILLLTHLVTISHVREQVLIKATEGKHRYGFWYSIKDIWGNLLTLPSSIKRICLIQLFAWIGWFPVLFWTSLYVRELYKRNLSVPSTEDAKAALTSEATRLGSRAMFFNALVSLIASIVCPFFVSGVDRNRSGRREGNHDEYEGGWMKALRKRWKGRPTCHLATLWAVSHGNFALCMMSTFLITNVLAATIMITVTGFSWAITQWVPFALIAEAIHTASINPSSQYIPGNDDNSDDDIPLRDAPAYRISAEISLSSPHEYRRLISAAKEGDDDEVEPGKGVVLESESHASFETTPRSALLGLDPDTQQSVVEVDPSREGGDSPTGEATGEDDAQGIASLRNFASNEESIENKAGIILGIHNVFVVIPQFIITGLSSIIFAIMDPEKSAPPTTHSAIPPNNPVADSTARYSSLPPRNDMLSRASGREDGKGTDSVALIFRIGGVSAAVACILCIQLAREHKRTRR